MSDSRLEKFIHAICSMDVSDLPVPLSRIEKLWNCLITGETPDFEPLSRNEKYLMAMLDRYDLNNLPAPMSRGEKLLYKIAMGETDLSDVPGYLSRYEELLKYLIENGGISGGDFEYVLHTINQSLYTLYTTAEKPVKSANLKGCTLVNISIIKEYSFSSTQIQIKCYNNEMIKTNTEYTIIYDITDTNNLGSVMLDCFGNTPLPITLGRHKIKFTTLTSLKNNSNMYISGGFVGVVDNIMIIEGDYINVDIPYFTGMQSVKLPVLTTIGKNLFNNNYTIGKFIDEMGIDSDGANTQCALTEFMPIKGGANVKLSNSITIHGVMIFEYDANKKFLAKTWANQLIKTQDNTRYYRYRANLTGTGSSNEEALKVMMMEYGTQASSYEPHKSNILTVNEEVELRGIGDVKDELDCLTGELTQRITSKTLRGGDDEDWRLFNNTIIEKTETVDFLMRNNIEQQKNSILKCDTIKEQNIKSSYQFDEEGISCKGGNGVSIWLSLSKTKATNVAELKTYLQSNPITVQYQLSTESIKTVDLTTVDQDGQPTKLKSFNDVTYVEINSDSIIPTVEIEVATKISETLSTLGLDHHDISNTQNKLGQTIDEQSENTDATMMATTEIYEQTL